ncbi:MAG: hypothetical protein ABEJ95_01275 [Candidatus Nanohalobium sp.]
MSEVDSVSDMVLKRAESLGFEDSDELIDTALETFLASRPDLRLDLAVSLYREGEVSLSRAVEVSGVGRTEFKRSCLKEGL